MDNRFVGEMRFELQFASSDSDGWVSLAWPRNQDRKRAVRLAALKRLLMVRNRHGSRDHVQGPCQSINFPQREVGADGEADTRFGDKGREERGLALHHVQVI